METPNKMWYVASTPWKGCPFRVALVVLTCDGQATAIKMFHEFYSNENLQAEEAVEVPFKKGNVVEEGES